VYQMVLGDVAICERQDYPCWGKATVGRREITVPHERWVGVCVGVSVVLGLPDATLGLSSPPWNA